MRSAVDGFLRQPPARVASSTVACPSGLRSTPRKRVWGRLHRGFKSHRHRQGLPTEVGRCADKGRRESSRTGVFGVGAALVALKTFLRALRGCRCPRWVVQRPLNNESPASAVAEAGLVGGAAGCAGGVSGQAAWGGSSSMTSGGVPGRLPVVPPAGPSPWLLSCIRRRSTLRSPLRSVLASVRNRWMRRLAVSARRNAAGPALPARSLALGSPRRSGTGPTIEGYRSAVPERWFRSCA